MDFTPRFYLIPSIFPIRLITPLQPHNWAPAIFTSMRLCETFFSLGIRLSEITKKGTSLVFPEPLGALGIRLSDDWFETIRRSPARLVDIRWLTSSTHASDGQSLGLQVFVDHVDFQVTPYTLEATVNSSTVNVPTGALPPMWISHFYVFGCCR